MLKHHQRKFTLLQKALDVALLFVSWSFAFYLKFLTFDSPYFFKYSRLMVPIFLLNYYFLRRQGIYSSQRLKGIWTELFSTITGHVYAFGGIILFIYFVGGPEKVSREFLIYYFISSLILLVSSKLILKQVLLRMRSKGLNLRYVIIFGSSAQAIEYVEFILKRKELGLEIKYWVDSEGFCEKYKLPCLNEFTYEVYEKSKPDYLVFGYPLREYIKIEKIIPLIQNELVDTIILPDMSFALIGYDITEFNGIPVISLNQPKLTNQHIVQKRVFDVFFSTLGLITLSPFLLLIAIGVKLTSRGPIFYGQKRVGLDGKVFTMWKFRTMKFDKLAEPGWTVENDPRRTQFGSLLRTTSLDELPQLWNVLVGNMSLVGPRPEQPHFVNEFKNNIPAYMLRHKMKAGITGWAQVNGWRGDTSLISRIDCDIYYIKNWSIWFDVVIIFMTFFRGFVNKNAY